MFEEEIRPFMEHIGVNGTITDKGIMSILETVAGHQSDEAGYGILDVENKGVSWVLLEWKLKIIKRPMYGEKLLVKTWGRNTQKTYTYRDYELYNANSELCVIATTKWVLVDINTKRIKKITPDVMSGYKICEKSVFDEQELNKIDIPEEKIINSTTIKPRISNIDVNGHVHNLQYIDYACEAIPQESSNNNYYNNIRISYRKEIKSDDIIICNYTVRDNRHIVVMKNEKDNTVNCIVELWN